VVDTFWRRGVAIAGRLGRNGARCFLGNKQGQPFCRRKGLWKIVTSENQGVTIISQQEKEKVEHNSPPRGRPSLVDEIDTADAHRGGKNENAQKFLDRSVFADGGKREWKRAFNLSNKRGGRESGIFHERKRHQNVITLKEKRRRRGFHRST